MALVRIIAISFQDPVLGEERSCVMVTQEIGYIVSLIVAPAAARLFITRRWFSLILGPVQFNIFFTIFVTFGC